MNRRTLLFRTAGLLAIGGGAWWARDHLLWPEPELAFGFHGATPWLPYARQRAATPTVEVTLGERTFLALIDTGAQYSVIDRALFDSLPEGRRSIFDMPLVAYGVGGGAQVGRGTTLNIALPGLTITGLRAAILNLGPLASENGLRTPLILGQDVLGQAILALDPERRHVRMVRRDVFQLPADMTSSPVRKSGTALVAEVTVEGTPIDAVVDTGASSLLGLSREAATAVGLLDGRPAEEGSSLVLGGQLRSSIIQARTVTFADHLYREVPVGVFDQPPLPNFPGGLVGMGAFEDRRVALDLGQGLMHVSRPMDLTVGR